MASPPSSTRAPICYFTDKLSAEIRISIYTHLFGMVEHITPKAHEHECVDTLVHTSILAVNQLVHNESLEALLNLMTVRVTFDQLRQVLELRSFSDLVRNIEIMPVEVVGTFGARRALSTALNCPRVRSVTVLCEFLTTLKPYHQHITVRGFAEEQNLGDVRCTDIGRYELTGELSRVRIVNSKLLKMWPAVVTTPADFDAFAEVRRISQEWELSIDVPTTVAMISHTSFRLWVALYEQIRKSIADEVYWQSVDLLDRALLVQWRRTTVRLGSSQELVAAFKHMGPVRELGPADDSATLEVISEDLSDNIAVFDCQSLFDNDAQAHGITLAAPSWPELGGQNLGIEAANRIKQNRELNRIRIPHPFAGISVDEAREYLLQDDDMRTIVGEARLRSADKRELSQVLFLHTAIYCSSKSQDPAQLAEYDRWAAELMRKYLRHHAVLADAATEVDWAGIDMLREVFRTAIGYMVDDANAESDDEDDQDIGSDDGAEHDAPVDGTGENSTLEIPNVDSMHAELDVKGSQEGAAGGIADDEIHHAWLLESRDCLLEAWESVTGTKLA